MNKLFFALFLSLQSHLAISAEVPSAWHAGIADPTVLGWLTVLFCGSSALHAKIKRIQIFWW